MCLMVGLLSGRKCEYYLFLLSSSRLESTMKRTHLLIIKSDMEKTRSLQKTTKRISGSSDTKRFRSRGSIHHLPLTLEWMESLGAS